MNNYISTNVTFGVRQEAALCLVYTWFVNETQDNARHPRGAAHSGFDEIDVTCRIPARPGVNAALRAHSTTPTLRILARM